MAVKKDQLKLDADEPVKVLYKGAEEGPASFQFKFEEKPFLIEKDKPSKAMPFRAAKHLIVRAKRFSFPCEIEILELAPVEKADARATKVDAALLKKLEKEAADKAEAQLREKIEAELRTKIEAEVLDKLAADPANSGPPAGTPGK